MCCIPQRCFLRRIVHEIIVFATPVHKNPDLLQILCDRFWDCFKLTKLPDEKQTRFYGRIRTIQKAYESDKKKKRVCFGTYTITWNIWESNDLPPKRQAIGSTPVRGACQQRECAGFCAFSLLLSFPALCAEHGESRPRAVSPSLAAGASLHVLFKNVILYSQNTNSILQKTGLLRGLWRVFCAFGKLCRPVS